MCNQVIHEKKTASQICLSNFDWGLIEQSYQKLAGRPTASSIDSPKGYGFPHLAEALRQAGVTRNLCSLPSCQSIFLTNEGLVVMQEAPLMSSTADVPAFDREAFIRLYEPTRPERAE